MSQLIIVVATICEINGRVLSYKFNNANSMTDGGSSGAIVTNSENQIIAIHNALISSQKIGVATIIIPSDIEQAESSFSLNSQRGLSRKDYTMARATVSESDLE
jgi:hypothetical protein